MNKDCDEFDMWCKNRLTKNDIYSAIFEEMTNGEVIMALFPNAEFDNAMPFTDGRWETLNLDTENRIRAMYEPTQLRTYANWWNAPYQKGAIRNDTQGNHTNGHNKKQ